MNTITAAHRLVNADATDSSFLAAESMHPVVTPRPCRNLTRCDEHADQLGHVGGDVPFLNELEEMWRQALRVLSASRIS